MSTIRDDSDLRRYRTELPNMLDDIGLSLIAVRLYFHYKRVCGANGGVCWEATKTTAAACRIAAGSVSKAKRELRARGLISIVPGHGDKSDHVKIIDIWPENMARFAGSRSRGERSCSSGERSHSPDEPKKEPIEERTDPSIPLEGEEEFWIEKAFECFNQPPRRLDARKLKPLREHLSELERWKAPALVRFYREEPMNSRERPFNSRKQSPERLIQHLPAQLALAVLHFGAKPPPPPPPPAPEGWEDALRTRYPDASPKSYYDIPDDIRRQVDALLAERTRDAASAQ